MNDLPCGTWGPFESLASEFLEFLGFGLWFWFLKKGPEWYLLVHFGFLGPRSWPGNPCHAASVYTALQSVRTCGSSDKLL